MTIKLDSKDHAVLEVLRQNSREPIRNIAKKTGIRPSTVHQRIKRLKDLGVIERFTLKLDNKALGENFIVLMLIATNRIIDAKVFANKHIKEAFGITGEYDLLLKMKFNDVESFNGFVIGFRKQYNLRKTLTMVVTVNIKEEL